VAAIHPKNSTEAGGEHEHGRAEMRDPASEEDRGGGAGKIGWRELHSAAGNVSRIWSMAINIIIAPRIASTD
jgi:hypothetical protein